MPVVIQLFCLSFRIALNQVAFIYLSPQPPPQQSRRAQTYVWLVIKLAKFFNSGLIFNQSLILFVQMKRGEWSMYICQKQSEKF